MKKYENFMFDLDDTIITSDWKAYKLKLGEFFVTEIKKIKGDAFDKESTKTLFLELPTFIFNNESKTKTKEQLSLEYLANNLGMQVEQISKIFKDMITEHQNWSSELFQTEKIEGVIKAIKILKEKKYRIFLATNTYFSRELIVQRLKWSGLDETDFNFIPGWETMGHGKPAKEYFEFFINNFNLDPNKTLMVGNSLLHDSGSENVGIDFYLIENHVENPNVACKITYHGTDTDFYDFIMSIIN